MRLFWWFCGVQEVFFVLVLFAWGFLFVCFKGIFWFLFVDVLLVLLSVLRSEHHIKSERASWEKAHYAQLHGVK